MALVFPDDFYLVGVTPQSGQFDLDRLTRHWKTNGATEEQVLSCATLPQKGDAHPLFPFMFVTDRSAQETSTNACALDVHYMGTFASDVNGPVLPPARNESDDAVTTASSKKTSTGLTLLDMATAQYYAPTNIKSFFTYGGVATTGFAPDPTDPIVGNRIITLTIADSTFATGADINAIIAQLFTTRIISTLRSSEVVAGKFWQNVSKKTNTLFPWIITVTPGDYLVMYSPGQHYTVGNTLVMNDGMGHTANIRVASLGLDGSIVGFTTLYNTFDYTTPAPIYTFGGSGTGAGFYNYHIT